MLYCFLDTSVLMEFTTFDEIDWNHLLKNKAVQLVVTLQVIKELDKHKSNPDSNRKRKRAQTLITKLSKYESTSDVRDGVSLMILTQQPKSSELRDYNLDPEIADCWIIGTAKWFLTDNPEAKVVTITGDNNFKLQSKTAGIDSLMMPEELRLQPEPDPIEKENQELKRELLLLKNSQPKLSIGFLQEDDSIGREIRFHVEFGQEELSNEQLDRIIETLRHELWYHDPTQIPEDADLDTQLSIATTLLGAISFETPPSKAQIDNYNNIELESYLEWYRRYLIDKYLYAVYDSQTRPIYVVLENMGFAPATDIDVQLHFPNGFTLSDETLSEPKEPNRPKKPKTKGIFEDALGHLHSPAISDLSLISRPSYYVPSESSGPIITKTNSYVVKDRLDSLKHNDKWTWEPLYLTFETPAKLPTAFEVEYQIRAANVRELMKGRLVIHLE